MLSQPVSQTVQANSQIDNQYGEPAEEPTHTGTLHFPPAGNKAVKKAKGVERIHEIWLRWE